MAKDQWIFLNTTMHEPDMALGARGNDTITCWTDGAVWDQAHVFAMQGNDILNLHLSTANYSGNQHGQHVYGGSGQDQFRFESLSGLQGTIVGRLDDFDPVSDGIWIQGHKINLYQPDTVPGMKVQIVEYKQQQWLEIRTATNGRALYALEGARQVPDGNTWQDEAHFISRDEIIPANLPVVRFENPENFIPEHLFQSEASPANSIMGENSDAGTETIRGTHAADFINSQRGRDYVFGLDGDDTIEGFMGHDTINGGAGDDYIQGGAGLDTIAGSLGDDVIAGGTDRDLLLGDLGNDLIYGGTENDTIIGGIGNDELHGGRGHDLIYGEADNDLMLGGSGNDSLHGGHDDDLLRGQNGSDKLTGGAGRDILIGGNDDGAGDCFVFVTATDSAAGAQRDIITDFTVGEDMINLHLIDVNVHLADDQEFAFSGNAAAGYSVWWQFSSPTQRIIKADIDGDAIADLEIQLNNFDRFNDDELSRTDFLL